MSPEVFDALKRSAAIPSLPQVVTRFLEVIRDPDFDFDSVAEVLAVDPGTMADILRLVNSPLFGVTRRVSSLRQGLTLLGLRRIRSLVLGRYLVDSLGGSDMGGIDPAYFWRRSLATAVLAVKFIDTRDPSIRDETFVAGLLSDIGVIVMAEALDAYAPVARQYAPRPPENLCELEMRAVAATHPQVSAAILESWQLPELITRAVEFHHETCLTDDLPGEIKAMAAAVQAGGCIAGLLCETSLPTNADVICRRAMETIDLDVSVLLRCLDEVEGEIRDLADVLAIDIISPRVYVQLAHQLSTDLSLTLAAG